MPADLQSAPIGRSGNLPRLPTIASPPPGAVQSPPRGAPPRAWTPPTSTSKPAGGTPVASESSFDVVSKIDRQEVDNALNQAAKEIAQRYDFKGTGASVDWSGTEVIAMSANSEERVKAVLDVLQTKLIKRGVSLKALDAGEPRVSGKEYRLDATLKEGLSQEDAKKIGKIVRDEGPKGVKTQVTGDELRVSAKSRDDLQAVIALLKGADLDVALQFVNYR
nr:YajQ family cyclic di-GMP-binding protein [Quadrisphaera sp. RL12-1S]